ncbi:patatin-like phospholipase family protein [Paraflavitalea sp. CAU 1676]|uniref:patatin-like phospholipase family protein n=1 Tax=Paraflavitalea sp. CAU 1676 TaxID=3032598 RepID=UPI0023DA9301|nr:patatin-like phospholipase family protein [Paraflavitalea sp. CAU 1676]MDF2191989.1 patatin-like phospholipase family protein [Paraflavitalea sp. CAU 1676]
MKHLLLSTVLFVSTGIAAVAQAPCYKNLVLEGGGVRGFAYAGAFEVLDSLCILDDIERVGGTSAGAIQAALLSVGYTPREILSLTAYVKPQQFNDGSWFVGSGMRRLNKEFGYYKGEKISEWLEELIARKTGNGLITFAELHRLGRSKGYKDLYITGTDLTYQCLRIFSHEQYPNMAIKDAVRISLSIPLYFKPVLIDDQGKVYEKKEKGIVLHTMVDGGALSNYPLFLFDSSKYMAGVVFPRNVFMENPETLGLMMESPEQIAHNRLKAGNSPIPIKSLKDYMKAVYVTLIDKPSPEANGSSAWKRTITISTLNYSGRVRKLPKKVVEDLLESGREGVRRFFASSGNPA